MLTLYDANGNVKELLESKDIVLKTKSVFQVFTANKHEKIGTLTDFGANERKMLTGFMVRKYTSISSNSNFFLEIRFDYDGIFAITNVTQTLGFDIYWLEKA